VVKLVGIWVHIALDEYLPEEALSPNGHVVFHLLCTAILSPVRKLQVLFQIPPKFRVVNNR